MLAAVMTIQGDTNGIVVKELADPSPDPGEAILDIDACALNHRDIWRLNDTDPSTADHPPILGSDIAGTVAAIGTEVENVSPGDRVVLCPNLTCGSCRFCRDGPENMCEHFGIYIGGFAEQCAVAADRLVVLPDEIETVTAATLPIAYMTALHMLRKANIQPGDRVFIPGAAGGVGVAAVQLASVMGAETVGTSTSRRKLDRLDDLGLTHGIESGDPSEIKAAVRAIGAPDVVINHLSGPFLELGIDVLRRGGRVVTCGRTAGKQVTFDIEPFYWQQQRLIGSTMGTQADLERVVRLVADNALEPPVDREFALAETGDAIDAIDDRDVFGKSIVRPTA